VQLARADLLYEEWLRRESRNLDAREQRRTAFGMFTRMGTEAFAGRAEREGLSNREIGARLFISPHTVQYPFCKVFTKLKHHLA
jgi:DNA-binding NarL/FixJ family response regulator